MSSILKLLLIEDNPDDAILLIHAIEQGGYQVEFERVETANAMQTALAQSNWDLIISDYGLPQFNALEALNVLKASGLDLPFIIVSGTIGEESAVTALKAGAHDFLIKGNYSRLTPAMERELGDAKIRREHRQHEIEMEAIVLISMTLRKAKTLDEMLSRLLDQTLELIKTDMGSIWLYDIAIDRINLVVQRGSVIDENTATSLRPGEGIPGLVVQSGQQIMIREFSTDLRVLAKNREAIPKGIGGVCIPLYSNENIVGAMFINVKLPREISTGDLRTLNALAEIGGNTIHRMYLLEQTLKQVERLRSLRNVDLAVSSTLDLQVSLKTVLKEITTQLKVDAAGILLLKPETNRLEFTAGLGFRTNKINSASFGLGDGHVGRIALDKKVVFIKNLNEPKQDFIPAEFVKDEGFVSYYGVPLIAKGEVEGALEIFTRSPLHVDMEWLGFLNSLCWQTAIAVDNTLLFENLQRSNLDLESAYNATIEGWSHALDLRDKETEGHTLRVTEMTIQLASTMDISEDQLVHIRRGALLHDIGKMGVPDKILHKEGSLTKEEWAIMHQHPQFAFDLLSPISYLQQALAIPYCHHEKWNGTGYPRGLSGTQIPLEARLFAVVDVWDAITSDRSYRKAWPVIKAIEYIRENSGIHFDPTIVDIFLENIIGAKP